MESGMIGLLLVVVVAVLAVMWYIRTRNLFARLEVKIRESDSGIDVALAKRYDTLTKMLDVAKAYAKHEAEVLEKIVNLRQGMSIEQRSLANGQMSEVLGKINVLAESYPELRSSENFRQLQLSIGDVEEHLQAARRVYNMNVSSFNQLLASWPASIVGNGMQLKPHPFFEAEAKKREDVKMDF